jgi:hypothetical protein
MSEPKKVPFDPISEKIVVNNVEVDNPIYVMMNQTIAAHHPSLAEARIKLMWRRSWKPDRDGIIPLGMITKIGDRERRIGLDYDAAIYLNYEWWNNPETTEAARKAVMDHELCHLRPVPEDSDDPTSSPKRDEHGNIVYYMRSHDIEDFSEIFFRHGIYKSNIQSAYNSLVGGNNPPIPTSPQEVIPQEEI